MADDKTNRDTAASEETTALAQETANPAAEDVPAVTPVHVPDDEDSRKQKVTLVLDGAFYITSYVAPVEDGGTLVFDRSGTEVLKTAADQIIADAAATGVTLRKAN